MSQPTDDQLQGAAYNDYKVIEGTSFLDSLPSQEQWLDFKNLTQDPMTLAMIELWYKKAKAVNGVPLRKDFSFEELAKYGSHLLLYKLTEDNRWFTTFCGTKIVDTLGIELTGKYIDEYGDKNALLFWLKNIKYITEQGMPFVEHYSLNFVDKEFVECADINLPLRSGDRDFPDMFFAFMSFEPNNT